MNGRSRFGSIPLISMHGMHRRVGQQRSRRAPLVPVLACDGFSAGWRDAVPGIGGLSPFVGGPEPSAMSAFNKVLCSLYSLLFSLPAESLSTSGSAQPETTPRSGEGGDNLRECRTHEIAEEPGESRHSSSYATKRCSDCCAEVTATTQERQCLFRQGSIADAA